MKNLSMVILIVILGLFSCRRIKDNPEDIKAQELRDYACNNCKTTKDSDILECTKECAIHSEDSTSYCRMKCVSVYCQVCDKWGLH